MLYSLATEPIDDFCLLQRVRHVLHPKLTCPVVVLFAPNLVLNLSRQAQGQQSLYQLQY